MRILVVDDEVVSRSKMEMLTKPFGESSAAESGFQAIAYYQTALSEGRPYQLVMLDINMPDMQGTEVLQQIRQLENSGSHRAVVVMVTAQSAHEQVIACIQQGCDDYIAKPFNMEIIRSKLNKFGIYEEGNGQKAKKAAGEASEKPPMADYIFNDISASLQSGDLALPAMPQVSIKFREMVHAGAALEDMAGLLKQDVVISSKLMRLANSALHRGYEKVQSLEQAISRLGLLETDHMVILISNQKLFMVEDRKYRKILKDLSMHSLACAFGAEALVLMLSKKLTIDPFTAGLFHDIGAFALVHIVAELDKRGRYEEELKLDDLFETVQCYHAMFGAKLLEKWAFEGDYIRMALCHNNLHAADSLSEELLVVHFTNLLAKSLGYSAYAVADTVDLSKAPSAKKLGLTEQHITDLRDHVQSKISKSTELIE